MSHDRYEDLERQILDDDYDAEEAPAGKPRKPTKLKRLNDAFSRVPVAWLTEHRDESPFDARSRLYIYLLYRTHWGQKPIKLTAELAAEVGVSPRWKQRLVIEWEGTGWLRVERKGKAAPLVCPIVSGERRVKNAR